MIEPYGKFRIEPQNLRIALVPVQELSEAVELQVQIVELILELQATLWVSD